ncbi:LLM class flavin-dependent oxidoreductase [Actinomadura rugatobispora]|uniref:LLM class flavin-dependent oxidoreductase n=1 Tax=Actinomadura rugatobispora TaxID=1994 RepID=A0ABW0ZMG0_9ACTN|nr:LLM class flavin-dependent oxidoreductase [Actinomadura rugatobispora]
METFTICPAHGDVFAGAPGPGDKYAEVVADHCRAAERLGAAAMLIYDFWQSLDPWVAGQLVLSRSTTLEPIVAVNPALTHPAVAARALAGLVHLYGRRVNLNVVAGAKTGELEALGLEPDPGGKYERMADFVGALGGVLRGEPYTGSRYRIRIAPPEPVPDPALAPRVLAPGSRSDGIAALLPRLDRALVMAKPRADLAEERDRLAAGGLEGGLAMLVGIVARDTDEEAWETAHRHHAGTRRDALTRKVFERQITSSQHRANLSLAAEAPRRDECLWYGAGRIGIDCPKLVGSYETVAAALRAYRELDVRTVVIDLPFDVTEYEHVAKVLALCPQED